MINTSPQPHTRPVVFLTSRFTTGGATLNAQMLTEQFIARGIQAELWCLYRYAELEERDIPVRVMLEHVPRTPLALARMVQHFRKMLHQVDPIAIVGFHPLANVLGALNTTSRQRFIATQRNPSESQSKVLRLAEARLGATSRYDANIVVSNAVYQSYAHYSVPYVEKLRVVHNGLPPLAAISEDKRAARTALGLPQDAPLVGNIGRLHPQKSPDFLLDVAERMPEITFVLAGDGPQAAEIRDAVRHRRLNVLLPGRLEGQDVTRLLRSLDLFLFPSRFEGFGRALVEALSEGIRVIAHDIPVTHEVMGEHGDFLPLDSERWAQTIRQRLAEPVDMPSRDERIAQAQSFSLQAMVENYSRIVLGAELGISHQKDSTSSATPKQISVR